MRSGSLLPCCESERLELAIVVFQHVVVHSHVSLHTLSTDLLAADHAYVIVPPRFQVAVECFILPAQPLVCSKALARRVVPLALRALPARQAEDFQLEVHEDAEPHLSGQCHHQPLLEFPPEIPELLGL